MRDFGGLTYEHFLYGPDEQAMGRVAVDLQRFGYLIPDPPRVALDCQTYNCGGCTLHMWLVVYGPAEKAFTDDGTDDIDAVCAVHGAVRTGGGVWIGDLPTPDLDEEPDDD